MTSDILVSVVVVSFNNERQIRGCIESALKGEDGSIEVIVVDNGSTDRTRAELGRYASRPNVKVVHNPRNLGFAEGVNMGVANSRGSLIFLLNPDAVIESESIGRLLRQFAGGQTLLIVQPKILKADGRGELDSTGDFIDGYGFALRRGADPPEQDHAQYDARTEIFSARGAALMTSRRLFDLVGGMDSWFFVTYEDLDFCWRARLLGARVVYVPDARVIHESSASLGIGTRALHGARNRIAMLLKNYGARNLLVRLPPAVFMAFLLAVATLVAARNPRLAMLRLRGLALTVLGLPLILRKRVQVQRLRRLGDDEALALMLPSNSGFLHWIRSGPIAR